MLYTATISSTPLRFRETRMIAGLLLQSPSVEEWRSAIVQRNVLQVDSTVGVIRSSNIIRARLEPLGEGLWKMIAGGPRDQALQAAFAGAIKCSSLLGDFMGITMRERRLLFAKNLEPRMLTEYLEGCRGLDPDMPHRSDATVIKLRSVVFSMLAEAGYLKDTRSLLVKYVYIDLQLAAYLRERSEHYVLRCLEVAQ